MYFNQLFYVEGFIPALVEGVLPALLVEEILLAVNGVFLVYFGCFEYRFFFVHLVFLALSLSLA